MANLWFEITLGAIGSIPGRCEHKMDFPQRKDLLKLDSPWEEEDADCVSISRCHLADDLVLYLRATKTESDFPRNSDAEDCCRGRHSNEPKHCWTDL